MKNRKRDFFLGAVAFVFCLFLILLFSSNFHLTGNVILAGNGTEEDPFLITNCTELQAMNENLSASYKLNNSIDMASVDCEVFQSGTGFEPIGNMYLSGDPEDAEVFMGSFDGQGYFISNLFINETSAAGAGLFGTTSGAQILDLIVVNSTVIGGNFTGGIVGYSSFSTLTNVSYEGNIYGGEYVGGLIGIGILGNIEDSFFRGNVTAYNYSGGLAGVTADIELANSYYNYESSFFNGRTKISPGALSSSQFNSWLENGKSLDENDYFTSDGEYYLINNVSDFKNFLAFSSDAYSSFKLTVDLDLLNEKNFYIPFLESTFEGNGKTIRNLNVNDSSAYYLGLFGDIPYGTGEIYNLTLENVSIVGSIYVGSIAGSSGGEIHNSSSSGSVRGKSYVGGLVGSNFGGIYDSYSISNVSGEEMFGGLTGYYSSASYELVENSFYDYDKSFINGEKVIGRYALYGDKLDSWLENGKFLDVNDYLTKYGYDYLITNVSDLKNLIYFGYNESLSFLLTDNIDLLNEKDFYIPVLAGEFDGDGYIIRNLNVNRSSVIYLGLFGENLGEISRLGLENVSVDGREYVGGLTGLNGYLIRDVYVSGLVNGDYSVGGLVGYNDENVINSYAVVNVSEYSGGLIGDNRYCDNVINSYYNEEFVESDNSWYDHCNQSRTRAQMKSSLTFSGWDFGNIWGMNESGSYPYLGNPGITDTSSPVITLIGGSSTPVTTSLLWEIDRLSDATVRWGINSSMTNIAVNQSYLPNHTVLLAPLTASTTYYYNITSCNMAGLCSSSGIYNFTTPASSSGQSSGGANNDNETISTYTLSAAKFSVGFTKLLGVGDRISFPLGSENHLLTLKNITTEKATILVSSTPQTNILEIGDDWEIDLDADGNYDTLVELKNITVGQGATVSITSLVTESLPVPVTNNSVINNESTTTGTDLVMKTAEEVANKENNFNWLLIGGLIVLILAVIIAIVVVLNSKRKAEDEEQDLLKQDLEKRRLESERLQNETKKTAVPEVVEKKEEKIIAPVINPAIDEINKLLDKSLEEHKKKNEVFAIKYYNQAIRKFKENNLTDQKTLERLKSISVLLL